MIMRLNHAFFILLLLGSITIILSLTGCKTKNEDYDAFADGYYEGYHEGYDDGYAAGVSICADEMYSSVSYLPTFGFLEDIMCSYDEYPELEEMLGYSYKELENIFNEYEYATSDIYQTIDWFYEQY